MVLNRDNLLVEAFKQVDKENGYKTPKTSICLGPEVKKMHQHLLI